MVSAHAAEKIFDIRDVIHGNEIQAGRRVHIVDGAER